MGLTPPPDSVTTPAQQDAPIDPLTSMTANLKSATEQSAMLQEQVTKLQGELTKSQDLYTQLKKDYEEIKSSLVLAKKQIIENEQEDVNFAEKAFALEKENNDLKDFISAIADKLDIKTIGLKLADVIEKCLTEIDAEEEIVKNAHVSYEVLQELGHEVLERVEDMSPIKLGSIVMQWIRQHKYQSPTSATIGEGNKNIFVKLGLWKPKT